MDTLSENIAQVINDLDSIQSAIIEKGIDIPHGTPTSEYGSKVLQISGGGGDWEGEFPPGWQEEQTGKALENISQFDPILWQQLGSTEIPFYGADQVDIDNSDVLSMKVSADKSRIIALRSVAPFIRVYDRNMSGKYVLAAVQPTSPTVCKDCAISSDGNMIFIVRTSGGTLMSLRWDGAQWLTLTQDVQPAAGPVFVELSPDDKLLILGHDRASWITLYKVETSGLTKLTNPAVAPTTVVGGIAFNRSGTRVAISRVSGNSPNVYIYSVTGTGLTEISTATFTAPHGVRRLAWSPDDLYLAVGHSATSMTPMTTYKYENDTTTMIPTKNYSASVPNTCMIWVGDRILIATDDVANMIAGPNLACAKVTNGVFEYISPPPLFPNISVTGGGQFLAKSSDGSMVIWGNKSLVLYNTEPLTAVVKLNDIRNISYGDVGFATESALDGQQCQVNVFPILRRG